MLRRVPHSWILVMVLLGIAFTLGSVVHTQKARSEQRRQAGMQEVIANAQPVIAAIHAYQKRHKKPPKTLESLDKSFPQPGPMAKNGWDYGYEKDKWTLAVSVNSEYTPNSGFGDTFVYRSDGQYEREAYGGILERFGEWGYYWE
ncbi:hypothetical protein [Armatimonas sp.]|uniref:type II secretion system protein n=1 Tax=Armatimonas sp. TaxID=1872638 RepID=UPI00286D1643|nr:hypothetical protein [Armatimonas sp.]